MDKKQLKTKIQKPIRKNILKVYLTDGEYDEILESSKKAGLSLSTFAQKVCLGSRVLSKEDKQARLELLKINSDLGRLGGLLKQAISISGNKTEIKNILHNIRLLQENLKAKVKSI